MDEQSCGNCKWWEDDYCDLALSVPEWAERLIYETFGYYGVDEFRKMDAGEGSECGRWESCDE